MEEKQLNERESLQLITIAKEQKVDCWDLMYWGWLLFLASVLNNGKIGLSWVDTFFSGNMFGLAILLIFAYDLTTRLKLKKEKQWIKTYTSDLLFRLNAGFFNCMMFIVDDINFGHQAISTKYGRSNLTFINFDFVMLTHLYVFWMLICGTALDFYFSIIGVCVAWIAGVIILFSKSFALVMCGHFANRGSNKIGREEKVIPSV